MGAVPVQPVVPRGQPHLPTRNRTTGNPAKLQGGVPVITKVIDLMPYYREAGGGGRILLKMAVKTKCMCVFMQSKKLASVREDTGHPVQI